ncbi:MAG: tRNA (adenosine(37)-N6)-dimethylallyltransferase MiaA [SAR202 cluster bacterium]|nr:tRNA (adenosine(37)-N6)-dimethylallyltransferase MiaA [SAR202 cluster bacterium]
MEASDKTKLLVVVGPTAAGKSSLAMHLATQLSGEIVGADSRHVYRLMDIGTAKPTFEDRREIPHHAIDVVDPDEDFGLVTYLELGTQAIINAKFHGNLPILVGGTGQYVWALLEGWQVPRVPPDLAARNELEELAGASGTGAVVDILRDLDAKAAARVDPNNLRRVIRAVEVARSGAGGSPKKIPPDYDLLVIGLSMPRPRLYRRIDDRVDDMLEAGWLDEVRGLLDAGYALDLPSMSGVGYRELGEHLVNGADLSEAIAKTKTRTHAFARRQHAWFKHDDPRIHWFDATDGIADAEAAVSQWLDVAPG